MALTPRERAEDRGLEEAGISGGGLPMIATMQTAHARFTLDFGAPRRPGFDGTARGRLLSQGIMNAIFVVIWVFS